MNNERKCLDHGYVVLVDSMGGDRTPAQTARTSYRNSGVAKTVEEDAKLTSYLVKHKHTTPLEFCQVRYYMKLPIFAARQFIRHRTASVNEVSYRYVKAAREFYIPTDDRMQRQSATNKQGSSNDVVDNPLKCREIMQAANDRAFDAYDALLSEGLAAELARAVLPVATYTEWYWQQDLHNLLHLLRLRLDSHAQYEIRVYAEAMLDLIRPLYPTIIAAWSAV